MTVTLVPIVKRTIQKIGQDISIARKKRQLRLVDVAEAAGISIGTMRRLESGEAGISIGTLASVLRVLGELKRLDQLIDIADDTTGLLLDQSQLPKRIKRSSSKKESF